MRSATGLKSTSWRAALSGAAQARYQSSGGTTVIQLSTDADAAPEFEIQLTGTINLQAGWLIL